MDRLQQIQVRGPPNDGYATAGELAADLSSRTVPLQGAVCRDGPPEAPSFGGSNTTKLSGKLRLASSI